MQHRNRPAGCHPLRGANIKGWRASNELFNASCEPAADASHRGRGRTRVLLCSATGVGAYKSRRLRPAVALALNNNRRDAETFSTLFQFHLCCSTSSCQHRRRKASREKPSTPPLPRIQAGLVVGAEQITPCLLHPLFAVTISGYAYAICLGHKDGERFIVDVVRGRQGPFDPMRSPKNTQSRAAAGAAAGGDGGFAAIGGPTLGPPPGSRRAW